MSDPLLPRYMPYDQFKVLFKALINQWKDVDYQLNEIGQSVSGAPIYGLQIGSGSKTVLMWSQMHGNESTMTRALINLLAQPEFLTSLENIRLYIIPILNPDAATAWTRNNANDVDLNRDALSLSQPESRVLRSVYEQLQPDICFNLHDQRTIYSNQAGTQPAQLSFLAPAGDEEKSISSQRLIAMNLINVLVADAAPKVEGVIGRYKDDFNAACIGDYMTKMGTPTVLFEAGHAGQDYTRNRITQIMTELLELSLTTINNGLPEPNAQAVLSQYQQIPLIAPHYCDVMIEHYKDDSGAYQRLQIAYHEQVKDGVLYFIPILIGVNKSEILNAHRVIDLARTPDFKNDLKLSKSLVITSASLGLDIFAN